jgi:hypothetical protein
MAKKAGGKKTSTEILDDNGTLIAASDAPRSKARGGGDGEGLAEGGKRKVPGPS